MHDLVVFNTFNFSFLLLMKLTLLNFEKKKENSMCMKYAAIISTFEK